MTADIGLDQPVGLKPVENALPVVGQGLTGQIEVIGIVEARQHLVAGQELRRKPRLPRIGLQLRPQRPQPFRVIG